MWLAVLKCRVEVVRPPLRSLQDRSISTNSRHGLPAALPYHLAIASESQIWTRNNSSEVAAKLKSEGWHDARRLLLNSHVTVNIDVHEIRHSMPFLIATQCRRNNHPLFPKFQEVVIEKVDLII